MINVYDFDGTIYGGNSAIDFFVYCLKHKPAIFRFLPFQLWHLFLYILGMESKTIFKGNYFVFIKGLSSQERIVEEFWNANVRKMRGWYMSKDHSRDVIVSASPTFLLQPVAKRLGVLRLIATNMDAQTGKISGKNCYGKEKVVRIKNELPGRKINECYSDSLSDLPLLSLAKDKIMVRGHVLVRLADYEPSMLRRLFLQKNFLAFIMVGCLSTLNGVVFAMCFSLAIKNGTLAFAAGYSVSLIVAYFLNSALIFKTKEYSLLVFVKFCISYIPNFMTQLLCVGMMIDVLHVYRLIAYVISAIVVVPVTFLMLSLFTFSKKKDNVNVEQD